MGHTQHTKVYTSFPQVISHYETLQQIITNCGISMQVAAWALITPPPLIFKQNKLKIRRRGGGLLCLTPSECSYTAGHRFGVPWPYGTIHYPISINIITKIFLSFFSIYFKISMGTMYDSIKLPFFASLSVLKISSNSIAKVSLLICGANRPPREKWWNLNCKKVCKKYWRWHLCIQIGNVNEGKKLHFPYFSDLYNKNKNVNKKYV